MKIIDTQIPDVKIIEPRVHEDERGFFYESFHQIKFEAAIEKTVTFVQDNHSKSTKGVLRGLHYQLPPKAQGKLVRVVQGEVFDVAVDIRKKSLTFGKWVGVILSAENKKQLWVPEGFAHGFLTLSDTTELLYKTTEYYAPSCERCIHWADVSIDIDWPTGVDPILSHKDVCAVGLSDAEVFT